MTPQIALSKSSYEAIHELLDISLTVDPKLATVFFIHHAHIGQISVQIYAGEWNREYPSYDKEFSCYPGESEKLHSDPGEMLTKAREYLTPENLAAVAAQKRAARMSALEEQIRALQIQETAGAKSDARKESLNERRFQS